MLADEFVRHALTLAPRVVMLLRFLFIESQGRCDIIDGGQLRRVYPFIDRLPMVHCDGPRIEQNPATYAWFCWDRSYRGEIVMRRIWDLEREQPYDAEADSPKPPPESPKPPDPLRQPAPAAPAAELDDGIPDFLRRKAHEGRAHDARESSKSGTRASLARRSGSQNRTWS
jgi:hypothetical protein